MKIEFDPAKNDRNIRERGLPFSRVAEFDFLTADVRVDKRKGYPEERFVALGFLDTRLHVLVFSETNTGIRVISFRKANSREVKRYEKAQTTDR